ncbi:methyltransferase [Methanocaldococcus villosus KIN24-T80]|uniref:Methyltransferase n=1 Tax=Methanocaldococcus villosus KIN24-T80 TaxID=1069083 RepID=N6VZE0_9EURY|nr:HemK2/MTQ2 family protein methyltransferase [Methanocaldococcus villosus]ENN96482.1 methyltransferase [Methanocaldococcus villosus KIN24-T80]
MKLKFHKYVYEPAEDSYLLLNNLVDVEGKEVLEIGTGCGLIAIACYKKGAKRVVATDINPYAVKLAKYNAKLNNAKIEIIESDLFENIKGKFDVIIFNPPYLPTEEDEKLDGYINYAFDGGKDGRAVLDRFLKEAPKYLKDGGVIQLVQSSLNDKDKTLSILKNLGFKVEIKAKLKLPFEELYIINAKKL